jgi:hypothetical protein
MRSFFEEERRNRNDWWFISTRVSSSRSGFNRLAGKNMVYAACHTYPPDLPDSAFNDFYLVLIVKKNSNGFREPTRADKNRLFECLQDILRGIRQMIFAAGQMITNFDLYLFCSISSDEPSNQLPPVNTYFNRPFSEPRKPFHRSTQRSIQSLS